MIVFSFGGWNLAITYTMLGSSLPSIVCRRAHVVFTLCSVRLYLQLFVGGLMSYLRYVRFVFTFSCLQEGSCRIYIMFGSSLPSVVCRRAHVVFTFLCLLTYYFVQHILCFCFVLFFFVLCTLCCQFPWIVHL